MPVNDPRYRYTGRWYTFYNPVLDQTQNYYEYKMSGNPVAQWRDSRQPDANIVPDPYKFPPTFPSPTDETE